MTITRMLVANRFWSIDPGLTPNDAMPDQHDTRTDSHRAVDDHQRRGLDVIQPFRGLAARSRRGIKHAVKVGVTPR